jgi:glutamine cyclotransferase
MYFMKYLIALFCLSLATIANTTTAEDASHAKPLHYRLLAERTHKPSLFTQGLELHNGFFYESSGLYDKSLLVTYPLAEPSTTWAKLTAPFSKKQDIPTRFFAEGLTLFNKKIYLLTWQEGTVFIYNADDLSFDKNLYYSGEGWGLTHNDKQLIRSDGSDQLFFHNSQSFAIEKTIHVSDNNQPVKNINELEYVEGYVWANIWHKNQIIKIDPNTGKVVANLDLTELTNKIAPTNPESVLNGIAYDETQKSFWITGKFWPKMFLIKID